MRSAARSSDTATVLSSRIFTVPTTRKADPVRESLEGAELTGVRCALFTAGDLEAVKKLVQGETGSAFRVVGKVKIRELMTFAVSEDLAALRMAVGTNVEVPTRK